MGICVNCYGALSADETITTYDGSTSHLDCEIVHIGHAIPRTDAEMRAFMGGEPAEE
jgi:hypothetical protein